jgi:hypothetical protein
MAFSILRGNYRDDLKLNQVMPIGDPLLERSCSTITPFTLPGRLVTASCIRCLELAASFRPGVK